MSSIDTLDGAVIPLNQYFSTSLFSRIKINHVSVPCSIFLYSIFGIHVAIALDKHNQVSILYFRLYGTVLVMSHQYMTHTLWFMFSGEMGNRIKMRIVIIAD